MSNKHPLRMNRRAAVKSTTAASASVLLAGGEIAARVSPAGPDPEVTFSFQEGPVAVEEVSIGEMREALDNGEYTIRELVQACLDRIAALDHQGPRLNAVIELNPDALAIADALDAELATGNSRGGFHGIPVLLKDNIATADGMENTAGSLALVGAKPVRDAFITKRLRDAGAVILGKTNLSEWANIRSAWSTSGWSGRGGQTLNAYALDRNPSGSSSGSGTAVTASYAPVAVGTETNGSIISPSAHAGLAGLKPTIGLVSRSGIIPISHSQDTAGPMARSVLDAAILLNVLAARDADDPAHAPVAPGDAATPLPGFPALPGGGFPDVDYVENLDPDALRGARIGVLREMTGFSPAADRLFARALDVLADAGAELVDPVTISTRKAIEDDSATLNIMLYELKAGLAAYIERYVDPAFPMRTIEDIIRFNAEHAGEELAFFDQGLFERAATLGSLDDDEYLLPTGRLQRLARTGIDLAIREHKLDALIAPTNAPASKIDLVNGDHWLGGTTSISAIAGYPILTVNAGYHFGLPVGVSFLGGAWSEATLLRLGHAFELRAEPRRKPAYLPGAVTPPGM